MLGTILLILMVLLLLGAVPVGRRYGTYGGGGLVGFALLLLVLGLLFGWFA